MPFERRGCSCADANRAGMLDCLHDFWASSPRRPPCRPPSRVMGKRRSIVRRISGGGLHGLEPPSRNA